VASRITSRLVGCPTGTLLCLRDQVSGKDVGRHRTPGDHGLRVVRQSDVRDAPPRQDRSDVLRDG
jgi:hypothetical protein